MRAASPWPDSATQRPWAPLRPASQRSLTSGQTRTAALCVAPTERRILRYKDEHSFRLQEFMCVLDKPLGLTLAPDPSGQIVVQSIKDGSPAANSHLIQVGDIVRKCSAVFGEDMWHATEIRRMRWAINNRTSKVKLVLERAQRPLPSAPVWYNKGQTGMASVERDTLQLPVSFFTTAQEDDWSQDLVSPGRPMFVGFHRSSMGTAQVLQRTSIAARQARLQQLREELVRASSMEAADLSAEALRSMDRLSGFPAALAARASSSSIASSSGASASTSASATKPATGSDKRVHPFLPWLLITSSRMDTRDLTMLASLRGLGSMLELSLSLTQAGQLTVKGAEGIQLPEINLLSLMIPEPCANSPGQAPMNGTLAATGQQLSMFNTLVDLKDPRTNEIIMLVHAAACLQRLAYRRLGSFHHSFKERCAILLHCDPGVQAKVVNLLAGWLHWYWNMPLQEAVLSAELATGCTVEQELLSAATEQLVRWADERMNQAVLTWKYGALSVSVAGDIVGGWNNHVSLVRCINPYGCKGSTSRGHFFLPLTGLKPGVYFYKFIVDGTWTVDPSAPKVIDTSGNYNNVLEVHARPPCITTKEKLQMARLQAAQLAYETKMAPNLQ